MQQTRGRRGANFVLRLTEQERAELERMRDETAGPLGLGPWMVWACRTAFAPPPVLPRRRSQSAMPARAPGGALPAPAIETALPCCGANSGNARVSRVVLDLCGGTGAWSKPYRDAGYDVRVLTLPDCDITTLQVPADRVQGVLCAPPCTEFSLAKNGSPRDIRAGLEVVSACLRIVYACKPTWWALENPVGLLSHYLGVPRDVWEPFEFGDPHTKATALWGEFNIPQRGPYVEPTGSAMDLPTAEERAITPEGFALAFFRANP